jgi:hypothetical protein
VVEAKQREECVHFVEGGANDQLEGCRIDGHLVQVDGLPEQGRPVGTAEGGTADAAIAIACPLEID